MMQLRKYRNQKGFTLVEIAIVLVIVGLVLFGVLKGADMVKSGKVKKTSKQLEQISAGVYAYMDKYKGKFPGEDGGANATSAGVLQDMVKGEIIGTDTMTNGYGGAVSAAISGSTITITSADLPCMTDEAAYQLRDTIGAILPTDAPKATCAVTLTIKK